MGLKSHSLIALMLQGKRNIKLRHSLILAKGLKLSSQEKSFLEALIQFKNAKSIEEKNLIALLLADMSPGTKFRSKKIEDYRRVSDWSHAAILSIISLTDFDGSMKDIQRRLKLKLSLAEVRSRINLLADLELLSIDNDIITPKQEKTFTKDDVPDEGVKEYHRQTSRLAIDAIDEVELDKREFQSFAISMDESKIPKIKKMIRHFISKIESETQKDTSNQVYQFNLQFFQLTENPSHDNETEAKNVAH